MFSPSSSSNTRNTPWVDGCWGPMLRTIVFAVPIAVSTVVIAITYDLTYKNHAKILPLALHRKIAAQRSPFELVGQENAAQVRVAFVTNSEQIENLAFQPIGALPDGHERIDNRLLPA